MIQGLVRKTGHGRDWGDDTGVCEVCDYTKTLLYVVLFVALFPSFS